MRCDPWRLAWLALAAFACSAEPSQPGTLPVPDSYSDSAMGDAATDAVDGGTSQGDSDSVGDGSASGDADGGASTDVAAETISDAVDDTAANSDTAPDAGADAETGFPDGFLDPPDTGNDGGAGVDATPSGPVGELYAHTGTELYRLDLADAKLTLVGAFQFNKEANDINDIAIDRDGNMFAVGPSALYACDRHTAKCGYLAKLPVSYNGLTFVPEGTVSATTEALVGMGADGSWNHIELKAGQVTIKKLGAFASPWVPSGDGFSVFGIGTFATIKGKGASDALAEVDPTTGKLVKVVGETGQKGLFGLAWWSGQVYAFAKTGEIYTLNIQTGKATLATSVVAPKGKVWYGAGVSTRANGG